MCAGVAVLSVLKFNCGFFRKFHGLWVGNEGAHRNLEINDVKSQRCSS